MRCLKRNLRTFTYKAYAGYGEIITPDGRRTGNQGPKYADPVTYEGNISPANYNSYVQVFGTLTDYTHTLVMDDPGVPIDENGLIVWNDKTYIVKRVARSINNVRIAMKEVTTDGAASNTTIPGYILGQ